MSTERVGREVIQGEGGARGYQQGQRNCRPSKRGASPAEWWVSRSFPRSCVAMSSGTLLIKPFPTALQMLQVDVERSEESPGKGGGRFRQPASHLDHPARDARRGKSPGRSRPRRPRRRPLTCVLAPELLRLPAIAHQCSCLVARGYLERLSSEQIAFRARKVVGVGPI